AASIVDVFDYCRAYSRLTSPPQSSHAARLAIGDFALEHERDALLEGELLGGAVGHLLTEGHSHTVQLQSVQCIEGGLDEHGSSSPSVVDGVAVWVVERKYSAPRTLLCEREAVGAAVLGAGKRSGCWSSLASRIARMRLRVGEPMVIARRQAASRRSSP